MSRIDRLREYAKDKGPSGASRDRANLDHYANRASENSQTAARATGKVSTNGKPTPGLDPPRVPSTGEVKLRDTSMQPKVSRGDARQTAKSDLNFVGSGSYLPKVRRGES
jgi:hypothetical protein